ncbi:MAG: hypothetical protein DI586_08640, partial [Micavibrio aeruginosavorus]
MSEPNFDAYRRYTEIKHFEPVEIIDGGKPGTYDDFIQVEYSGFVGLDGKKTQSLVDLFVNVADDKRTRPIENDDIITGPMSSTYSKAETREWFQKQISEVQTGVEKHREHGGGLSDGDAGIVYVDTRSASLDGFSKMLGKNLGLNNPEFERLEDIFTREHEAAHQMLNLKEAGADYIAAVRLRQTNPGPETDAYLQTKADFRTLLPFRTLDNEKLVTRVTNYGYGNATGIHSALYASANEIKNMTLEEMYSLSQNYESLNGKEGNVPSGVGKNSMRPEMKVWQAMQEVNPTMLSQDYKQGALASAAQKLIDNGAFLHGS